MDSLLYHFLMQNYSPEQRAWFLEGYQILAEFYQHSYGDVFVDILSNDEMEASVIFDRLNHTMLSQLSDLLTQHGVYTLDTATPQIILELCRTLHRIQHLEDYQPIALTLESMLPETETFCKIVELASAIHMVDLEDAVDYVEPGLLRRIGEIADRHISYAETPETPPAEMTAMLKRAQAVMPDSIGMQMLAAGALVGQPFESYVPFVAGYLTYDDPATVAQIFLSIILLSSDGYSNPQVFFREIAEAHFDNPALIAKVDLEIQRLMTLIMKGDAS